MFKFVFCIFLYVISYSTFAKTVKENEISNSQNVIALFNKACMDAFLDEEEFSNFIINNNFEDLNVNNIDNTSNNQHSLENQSKEFNNILLSTTGKHYSIIHDNRLYFLDVDTESCSVLVKAINQNIFNLQFKEFKKELTNFLFNEQSKSFESIVGSTNYKLTAYSYYTKDNKTQLPFSLYLTQTSSRMASYQLKLTVRLDKKIEHTENVEKKSKVLVAHYFGNIFRNI